LGVWVEGLGVRVSGLWCRAEGEGLTIEGLGLMAVTDGPLQDHERIDPNNLRIFKHTW